MQFEIVPFEAWHMEVLGQIEAADGSRSITELNPAVLPILEKHNSWSLVSNRGEVVACGGTVEEWPGRHAGWLYFTPRTSQHMIRLYRLVKFFLSDVRGRIEATVLVEFEPGHRFVRMLGFEVENPPGLLKRYDPDGRDHIAYVRFQ